MQLAFAAPPTIALPPSMGAPPYAGAVGVSVPSTFVCTGTLRVQDNDLVSDSTMAGAAAFRVTVGGPPLPTLRWRWAPGERSEPTKFF